MYLPRWGSRSWKCSIRKSAKAVLRLRVLHMVVRFSHDFTLYFTTTLLSYVPSPACVRSLLISSCSSAVTARTCHVGKAVQYVICR